MTIFYIRKNEMTGTYLLYLRKYLFCIATSNSLEHLLEKVTWYYRHYEEEELEALMRDVVKVRRGENEERYEREMYEKGGWEIYEREIEENANQGILLKKHDYEYMMKGKRERIKKSCKFKKKVVSDNGNTIEEKEVISSAKILPKRKLVFKRKK